MQTYTRCINALRTKNLQPLLNINETLLSGRCNRSTEDQLCTQFPILRDVPCLCDLLVNQRVIVLQVGAKPFLLEGSPDCVLVHSVGMGGPDGELFGEGGELLLQAYDGGAVDEEEDL